MLRRAKTFSGYAFDEMYEKAFYNGLNPAIFKDFKTMIIFGQISSGKTTFLTQLYKNYLSQKFDEVHVFAKNTDTIKSYKKMENNIISYKFTPDIKQSRQLFDDFYGNIQEDYEENEENEGKKPKKRLVIIDDYYDPEIKKNSGIINLFINGRHIGITVVFICQYTKIMASPIMKTNTQIFVLFKTNYEDWTNMRKIIENSVAQQNPEESYGVIEKLAVKIYNDLVIKMVHDGLVVKGNEIYHYHSKK